MLVHNIDTADMLSNGQIGTLMDVIKTTKNVVDTLVVKLVDGRAGEENRKKNPNLTNKYPDCVFIERVSLTYSQRRNSYDVGSTATVIQFQEISRNIFTSVMSGSHSLSLINNSTLNFL